MATQNQKEVSIGQVYTELQHLVEMVKTINQKLDNKQSLTTNARTAYKTSKSRNRVSRKKLEPSVRDMSKLLHLKEALQVNMRQFTKHLLPDDGLIDMLLERSCLVEEEYDAIRSRRTNVLKTRSLILKLQARSPQDIQTFLDVLVENKYEHLVKTVNESLEIIRNNPNKQVKCVICVMKAMVDVAEIADHLWSNDIIPTHVYRNIVEADNAELVRKSFWEHITASAVTADQTDAKHIIDNLIEALGEKYKYIAEFIRKLPPESYLMCCCLKYCKRHRTGDSVYGSSSDLSTVSDESRRFMRESNMRESCMYETASESSFYVPATNRHTVFKKRQSMTDIYNYSVEMRHKKPMLVLPTDVRQSRRQTSPPEKMPNLDQTALKQAVPAAECLHVDLRPKRPDNGPLRERHIQEARRIICELDMGNLKVDTDNTEIRQTVDTRQQVKMYNLREITEDCESLTNTLNEDYEQFNRSETPNKETKNATNGIVPDNNDRRQKLVSDMSWNNQMEVDESGDKSRVTDSGSPRVSENTHPKLFQKDSLLPSSSITLKHAPSLHLSTFESDSGVYYQYTSKTHQKIVDDLNEDNTYDESDGKGGTLTNIEPSVMNEYATADKLDNTNKTMSKCNPTHLIQNEMNGDNIYKNAKRSDTVKVSDNMTSESRDRHRAMLQHNQPTKTDNGCTGGTYYHTKARHHNTHLQTAQALPKQQYTLNESHCSNASENTNTVSKQAVLGPKQTALCQKHALVQKQSNVNDTSRTYTNTTHPHLTRSELATCLQCNQTRVQESTETSCNVLPNSYNVQFNTKL